MASCNGACSKFNAANANWFKIGQSGQSNGVWTQQQGVRKLLLSPPLCFMRLTFVFVVAENGRPSTAKIPSGLAPGEYLIRNEIIGLHNAMSPGGAEFYPSCTQLKVTGNGSPKPSNTVKFPGGYKTSDKGLVFDVRYFNTRSRQSLKLIFSVTFDRRTPPVVEATLSLAPA